MSSTLAERTLQRATAALKGGPVACLPEIVKLLGTLSANSVEVSVGDLAEVIQKDPIILSKVIGAANTYGYNPAGVPVTTVTQAVHVIGYERIRTLAMSLVLMKHANGTQTQNERNDAVALALTSGCVAQGAAESRLLLDPEQAFVCASLRNFGRIVLATFMAEEYREAARQADSTMDDEAWRETFGLTPLELGRELLKAADLPEPILAALKDVPKAALAVLDTAPDSQMLAVTDFSAKFAGLVMKADLSAAGFSEQAARLAESYSQILPGIGDEIMSLVKHTEEQFAGFMRTFGIKTLPPQAIARLRHRVAGIDPSASIQAAASQMGTTPPRSGSAPPRGGTMPAMAKVPAKIVAPVTVDSFDWAGGVDQLTRLLRMPGVSRSEFYGALVEIVQRGLSSPNCIVFSSGQAGASEFTLSHPRGPQVENVDRSIVIRSGDRTVLGVCLSRHENVLIHAAADPKIAPYLPDWIKESGLGSFALLPLGVPRETCGLILAGWPNPNQLTFNSGHNRLLRPLLALAGRGGR